MALKSRRHNNDQGIGVLTTSKRGKNSVKFWVSTFEWFEKKILRNMLNVENILFILKSLFFCLKLFG